MDTELEMINEAADKDTVKQYYMRKIYSINNKIARLNYTKKHYLSYKDCCSDDPDKTFIDYIDSLKATYQDDVKYYKKRLSEV